MTRMRSMRWRARSRWPAHWSSGRDNLGIIDDASEVETLARSVQGSEGVVFVPFSGLFAPYWRDDAREVIVGLTRFANKASRAGRVGGNRLPDLRPGGSDARRHGPRAARGAAGRRGHDQERAADAVPGRHSRLAWPPLPWPRSCRRRRLRRGPCHGFLVEASTSCARTTRSRAAGSPGWTPTNVPGVSRRGAAASIGRWA